MARLVECAGCGGLKRAQSERCPHCQLPAASKTSVPKKALTLLESRGARGLHFIDKSKCRSTAQCPDASPWMGQGCIPRPMPMGSFPFKTRAMLEKMYTQTDAAYGLPPLEDAGVNDALATGDGTPIERQESGNPRNG